MKMAAKFAGGVCLSLAFSLAVVPHVWGQANPLKLVQSVSLPGYSGDFDHFAVDHQRNRLLLAAEDHATLEVFDLSTLKHLRTISGFGAPHSTLVRPGAPTIFVTDSGPGMSKLLDADTYAVKGTVPLVPGADSIAYDAKANIVYIVTGGKDVDMKTAELAAVDPVTGRKLGSLSFNDNHVEALTLDKNSDRLFINLTQTNKLAVVDRRTMKLLSVWPVPPSQQNAMVAFDAAQHRLYVVCRQPGMVVVMNSDTGKVITTQPAPLRADQVVYDQPTHRLFVPGGEGYIGVYDTTNPDHLKEIAKVPSAVGAKTGILIPEMHRLFVAVSPGESKSMAKVLAFAVQP